MTFCGICPLLAADQLTVFLRHLSFRNQDNAGEKNRRTSIENDMVPVRSRWGGHLYSKVDIMLEYGP